MSAVVVDAEVGRGEAGALLRRVREEVGLTQARLAERAGTAQSAIAAYETGRREPTVPALARMLAAAGMRLELGAVPVDGLVRLSDLARALAVLDLDDTSGRLRLVGVFLATLQRAAGAVGPEDPFPLRMCVATVPPPTGDVRFDALLAALAEHLCVHAEEVPPPWVQGRARFLEEVWWVDPEPTSRARALQQTPASFRRHGVMLDLRTFDAP